MIALALLTFQPLAFRSTYYTSFFRLKAMILMTPFQSFVFFFITVHFQCPCSVFWLYLQDLPLSMIVHLFKSKAIDDQSEFY